MDGGTVAQVISIKTVIWIMWPGISVELTVKNLLNPWYLAKDYDKNGSVDPIFLVMMKVKIIRYSLRTTFNNN